MYKILGIDNREYGPVTADQVRLWIRDNRLNAQSHALPEGSTSWKPLSMLPEFSAALAVARPPGLAPARPWTGPVQSESNPLAVWSLVCGCASLVCCPFVSLAGLVLGVLGMRQAYATADSRGRGVAIAGIVTSGIGVLVFCLILIALLSGSLAQELFN